MRAMLNGYEIKGRNESELPEKIEACSGGWPQHLEYYMVALAQQLSDNGYDLSRVDVSAVLLNMLCYREWEDGQHHSTMPEGMSEEEFLQAMIVAGVVYRDFTTITIPIPSFRQYLIDQGE